MLNQVKDQLLPKQPTEINTPSQSPEDGSSGLLGALKLALNKTMQNLDCCLPAKIISYDRATNRATVQPLYKISTTGGGTYPMAKIQGVPTLLLGGGDVFVSFDLKAGDLGWIIANDQDISLFLQNYQAAAANTKRMHSFSDAIFIPDLMKGYQLATEAGAGETVIQSKMGATVIGISDDKVRIDCKAMSVDQVVVQEVELMGKESTLIPKDSLAQSNNMLFKLLEDVTLNDAGQGTGIFAAVEYGSYICPENTLTEIVDSIEGWATVNNPRKGEKQTIQKQGIAQATAQSVLIQAGTISIEGAVTITGDVRVEGNITASGQIQGNT